MSTTAESKLSRFERVKAILARAACAGTYPYEDYEKYWELEIDKLEAFEIHGIPLIAPEEKPTHSCCGNKEKVAQATHEEPQGSADSRGARSGLIKGLRGEFPFDGKRLPRLPWGADPLPPEEIAFIERWIDDGCPVEDRVHEVSLQAGVDTPGDERAHLIFEPAEDYRPGNALRQRKNLDFLSPAELERLRHAFRELYHLNRWPADRRNYNNQALIHQNHCQHAWERFLPWHRIYMYEFEKALQDVVPEVTLPYWDWTLPRYRDGDLKGDIIPESFKGFLTEQSIRNLERRCRDTCKPDDCAALFPLLTPLVNRLFTSQRTFFDAVIAIWDKAGLDGETLAQRYRTWFIDELLASNSLWYPLRYPAEFQTDDGKPSTINEIIHYHYPSLNDVIQIQSLNNFRDYGGGSRYNDSYGWIDQNPHNTLHIWCGGMNPDYEKEGWAPEQKVPPKGVRIGGRTYHSRKDLYAQPQFGDMFSNLTASFDPIFWPHHINVDRLWWEWQCAHPHCEPADPSAVLTPWNYTVRDTYDIHRFGYEYVVHTCIFPVGHGTPISRMFTQATEIPAEVMSSSKAIELRLHRVPQMPLSCYIRAFVNLRDACAATDFRDNAHFAGYIPIFGHGICYGGPGHCDLPPDRQDRFDLRDRHHNTPRNYRLDVTRCVQHLAATGATRFEVALVVVGVDGREIPDMLRLESVSLNFKD
ncbi:Tyrosinase family protein [Sulfidibacter corallicola]|uniref:Tyrosinase family protein n=1 Tax=Sulfidibacter corallicola TaxID=2818388 RepID=A0A8A4TY47_SULCO|nr:tyrosinase family protein [Sulfidibacter corallicola]QTD54257.1 tyrosinase family protein [Sulfidibacter corallicola]